ncbi:hypothetical protein [Adlercreutzia rubneri]|mgnify:CR=1 FL=1
MPALEALLAPENLLVNVVCGLPVQFVYLGLLTWVLPPRSARTFWTVEILYQGVAMFLKALYPAPLRIAVGVFGSFVIPLFLLRGSLLRRLVVCSLCIPFRKSRRQKSTFSRFLSPLKHIFQIKKRQLSGVLKYAAR